MCRLRAGTVAEWIRREAAQRAEERGAARADWMEREREAARRADDAEAALRRSAARLKLRAQDAQDDEDRREGLGAARAARRLL